MTTAIVVGKGTGDWVRCGEAEGEAVGFSEGMRVVEGEGIGVLVKVSALSTCFLVDFSMRKHQIRSFEGSIYLN